MAGDEKTRLCSYCNKHVQNLDALSVSERHALFSSPAAKLCARYRIAIRRPAKGREKSYYRHLLKYGVGVALGGSVLLVLWEMEGKAEKEKYYKASLNSCGRPMPREYYMERESHMKGDVMSVDQRKAMEEAVKLAIEAKARSEAERALRNPELVIDKKILDGMIEETASEPVAANPK